MVTFLICCAAKEKKQEEGFIPLGCKSTEALSKHFICSIDAGNHIELKNNSIDNTLRKVL
jgi:hypothetical protein